MALLSSLGWISEMSAERPFSAQKSSISCVSRMPPIRDLPITVDQRPADFYLEKGIQTPMARGRST